MPTERDTCNTDDSFVIPREPPISTSKDVSRSKNESETLPSSLRMPKPASMLTYRGQRAGSQPPHRESGQPAAALLDHPRSQSPDYTTTTTTTTTAHSRSDCRAVGSKKMESSSPSALEGEEGGRTPQQTTQRAPDPVPEEAGEEECSGDDGHRPCSSSELCDLGLDPSLVNFHGGVSAAGSLAINLRDSAGGPLNSSSSSSSSSRGRSSSSKSTVQAVHRTDSSESAAELGPCAGSPERDRGRSGTAGSSSSSCSARSSCSDSGSNPATSSDSDSYEPPKDFSFVKLVSSPDDKDVHAARNGPPDELDQYEGVVRETGGAGRESCGLQQQRPPAFANTAAISCRGLVFSTQECLQSYVNDFILRRRDSGICVWPGMTLAVKEGMFVYEEGEQFRVLKILKQNPPRDPYGVFLCYDIASEEKFVLKRFKPPQGKLVGTEFLVKHCRPYLPKIYGVHAEKDIVNIFQEFIQGVQVTDCKWSLRQQYQFAERMLEACAFLHTEKLAHCDLKESNVLVRDPERPESLVIIDFESARHPDRLPFTKPALTTTHLPPWFEDIFGLESFDPILLTLDMWAFACILIPSIARWLSSDDRHPSEGGAIWRRAVEEVVQSCATCQNQDQQLLWCQVCRDRFYDKLKAEGPNIVEIHLGHLMEPPINEEHWPPLHRLVEYLTDTENVKSKNIFLARQIFKGNWPPPPTDHPPG